MRVAAVQFKADRKDRQGSRDRLLALCAQAAERGATLVVCPEMALTGYLFTDAADVARVAEPAQGESFAALSSLAAHYGVTLVCGYPERAEEAPTPCFYNSAWIIGPDGTLLSNYRKRLLYTADETWAKPGDTPYPQVRLPWGTLTAGICMDLNDDRFVEFLYGARADVIAFCTNWLEEGLDLHSYWRFRLLLSRSVFVAANTYGSEVCRGHDATEFAGQSAIFDSRGRTLAKAPPAGDALISAEVRLSR